MAFRGFAHAGEVTELQMHVVEQIRDKPLGHGRSARRIGRQTAGSLTRFLLRILPGFREKGSWLFHFELADDLRLALVENLKIFLAKITYGVPPGIANYCPDHDQLYVYFECCRFVARRKLR